MTDFYFFVFFIKNTKINFINKISGLSSRQQLLLRAVTKCLGLHNHIAGFQGFGYANSKPKHIHIFSFDCLPRCFPTGGGSCLCRQPTTPFGWGKLCPWRTVSSNGRLVGGWEPTHIRGCLPKIEKQTAPFSSVNPSQRCVPTVGMKCG